MRQTATAFLVVTVLTALLAALSIAVQAKGYPQGGLGLARLDALASAATFVPLAALYAFAALLIVLSPPRAAGFMHARAAGPIHFAAVVLLATILGVQVARLAFGNTGALRALLDWQFVFAAGIVVAHEFLDLFRRDILLRTIGAIVFLAATLACLFWTLRF